MTWKDWIVLGIGIIAYTFMIIIAVGGIYVPS